MRTAVPGVRWPGIADAQGAAAVARQWFLARSQCWDAQALERHQFIQLRRLLEHAMDHVPRYAGLRDRFPASLESLDGDAWRRLPILTKADVRSDPASLHAASYPQTHGAWHELATSGSTGEPVRIRHTALSIGMSHALAMREHLLHERDLARKLASIRLAAPGGQQPGWGVMSTAFETGPGATMDVLEDVDRQLDWLLAQAPAYLMAHPSNVRALIDASRARGVRPEGLEEIVVFGETVAPDLRGQAADAWGARIVENYSCREAGTLAFECPVAEGLHVHAEGVYLEVLRKDGSPCEPGELGRVVITPLHNFAMPLVRYEIGDYAQAGPSCACGRGLPRLDRVAGRVTAMAVDPTGRRFWPGLRASMLTAHAPLRQVRLVQHAVDRIELLYVMERELSEAERARCALALEEMLRYRYAFEFTRVAVLERGPGGKYDDFISRLEP